MSASYYNHPQTQQAILQTLDEKSNTPVVLSRVEISQLLEFMTALTYPVSLDLTGDIPASVPSGLPVAD